MHLPDLLRYWRASLVDGPRHLDWQSVNARPSPLEALEFGLLPTNLTRALWEDAEVTLPRKDLRLPDRPVLILPAVLAPKVEHASTMMRDRRVRVPVWVPAWLDGEGRLKPTRQDPLIDRDVLAPLGGDAVTFGTVAAQDAFLSGEDTRSGEAKRRTSWAALWAHVDTVFQSVFERPPQEMGPPHYRDLGAHICIGKLPNSGPIFRVRKLYDTLISGLSREDDPLEPPPLLETLTQDPPEPRLAPATAARRHLAQMSAVHPLNPGQREALYGALDTREGEIAAVNGPPGTGKTTLLQSLIGALWVEAAVEGAEPPVIVATSTNNQAITNILDSFAKVEAPPANDPPSQHLLTRWLPEVSSYGLYFPSESRADAARERYQVAEGSSHKWGGLPATMETAAFIELAKARFLENFCLWAGQEASDLQQAVVRLHRDLTRNTQALRQVQEQRETLLALRPAFEGQTPEVALVAEQERHAARRAERAPLREKAEATLAEVEAAARPLDQHAEHALHLIEPSSLMEMLLAWLPAMKRRLSDRTRRYLVDAKLADPAWGYGTLLNARSLRAWLDDRRALLRDDSQARNARETLDRLDKENAEDDTRLDDLRSQVERWRGLLAEWTENLGSLLTEPKPDLWLDDGEAFEAALDIGARPWLFHLAARYWEGRWVQDAEETLKNPKGFNGQSRHLREAGLRRFCKLTPCLVVTTHSLPKHFDYFDPTYGPQPLLGGIDLLIIEEAGQVAVDLGAASLAFAKRAVIVGDKDQIEPVWSVSPAMDIGNAREQHLDPETLRERGLSTSSSSMMTLARAATTVTSEGEAGLFLSDHWRCRAGVIAFCNDLVYRNRLCPRRPEPEHFLPPLGYAHVSGRAERSGTGWRNADEAAVIARWLKDRRTELLAHYGAESLKDIAAVVTPFKAQIPVLDKALKREGLEADGLTVGTVHALQGAERPLVIFSPVYGNDHQGGLFFDRGPNMLNVAVSRAKDSFLVFGAMGLFRPDGGPRPSSVLARRLFATPENEITDIEPLAALSRRTHAPFERIDNLDGHRQVLREALETATNRLLIISPFLSHRAIEDDGLLPLVEAAARRGVDVRVAFDQQLNQDPQGRLKVAARLAFEHLVQAGATATPVRAIHAKTLAVDDHWLVEGSFNWLSAVRDRASDWRRRESSLLYRGQQAEEMIRDAWMMIDKHRDQKATASEAALSL